jgi:hypothetical protein
VTQKSQAGILIFGYNYFSFSLKVMNPFKKFCLFSCKNKKEEYGRLRRFSSEDKDCFINVLPG